jgi:hypothetical protein
MHCNGAIGFGNIWGLVKGDYNQSSLANKAGRE